jgi:hypothetical protein
MTQLAIAFVGAVVVAYFVGGHVADTHFQLYARQYPHDGQDGLGAAIDGLTTGAITFVVAFCGLVIA